MVNITELDFEKETFQEGKEYFLSDIQEMAKRNKTQLHKCDNITLGETSSKLGRKAYSMFLEEDSISLWFIFSGYFGGARIYKCVYFR